MIVLGIDSSPNNCGWCAWDTADGAKPVVGVYHPGKYGDNNLLLLRDVRKWALRMIDDHSPVSVWVESVTPSPQRMNTRTWIDQMSVLAGIDNACELNDLACYQCGPGQWRKRFLGSAAGSGEELKIKAVKRVMELGVLTDNDHIAEAIGICEFGMASVDREYLKRSEADRVRRELAIQREVMQGVGKPLINKKNVWRGK
jgi:hypothetical protein